MAFILFGVDKWKARHKRWRIPEWVLLLSAALGGSLGALLSMYIFRHKTRKFKFYFLVPLMLIIQVLTFIYFSFMC
ncbi:MAG: DUF1294 domain-containing protein [Paludibacteraceae bacterium]|nr:DUF1294 domain-containing protein [Paludibacteraceae bacterium]